MIILVTGATGFVGRFLCEQLLAEGHTVRGTLLPPEKPSALTTGVKATVVQSLGPDTDWSVALEGVDTIIHLAARVHIMQETASDPLSEFRKVNLQGTEQLARQAAQANVNRFVFMSTIGVNGDNSGDKPYTEGDAPHPHNPYSASKHEAELTLQEITAETGLETVIVRAPLVYGPGNPGNFLSLLRYVSNSVPLPLSSISNKRSLLYVGNLVDALAACATHPVAAGKTYLVSDGEDVSTPDLIRRTASALGVPARLFPFPVSLIKAAGKLAGKSPAVDRLTGSLTVESLKIRQELGWTPPFTMECGLRETAKWYKMTQR